MYVLQCAERDGGRREREGWRKESKRGMKRECAQTSSLNFAASSGILKAFGVNANPWVARTGLETKQEVPGKWFT